MSLIYSLTEKGKIPWRMFSRWNRAVLCKKKKKKNLVVTHIHREGNNTADRLAGKASSTQQHDLWMGIPEDFVPIAKTLSQLPTETFWISRFTDSLIHHPGSYTLFPLSDFFLWVVLMIGFNVAPQWVDPIGFLFFSFALYFLPSLGVVIFQTYCNIFLILMQFVSFSGFFERRST